MKIGIINNLYKPYHKGGTEKVCENIINQLEKNGHSCFIITTKPQELSEMNQNPKTYYLNSNYYNLGQKNILYRFFWQINNFINFYQKKEIKKILINEKPDLILTHNLMGINWKTFKIIKRLKIKHHHFLHDIQLIHPSGLMIYGKEKKINSLISKIYQKIIKKIIDSPDLIISPSDWLLQEHKKRNYFKNSKIKVQANPQPFTDIKKIDQTTLENYKKNKNTIDFLFIGQIEEHKGIIFLIETFKKIGDKNIKLKIIGNGSLIDKIRKYSEVDNRIEILEQRNKEEIAIELQKNDCLIVPSLCYENSPTVIYEAKAFSLPIIASNLGGIPELITNKERLFEPGNQINLIDKINNFIENNKNNLQNL